MPNSHRNQSTTQCSETFSVDPKTLRGWVKDGCPATKPKTKGKPWMLDPTEVAAWLKSKGRDGSPGRPRGAGSEKLEEARERKESAMADNWELRNARERSELVPCGEVERGRVERVVAVRNRLMGCGASIAPQCEHRSASEIQTIIDQHMRGVCEQFAAE